MVGRDQASYDCALPLRYLTTRVRQADRADGIAISDFEGTNALEIREVYDGYVYVTQIYCYEGQMRELFSAEDSGLMPEDGEVLMPLEDMNLSLEGELLTIDVRHPNGQTDTLRLCLRPPRGGFAVKNRATLTLMEQLVMILVFALAAVICLQVFVTASKKSRDSEDRDRAVDHCAKRSGGYQGHRGTAGRCGV